jgi:hypothetical protein
MPAGPRQSPVPGTTTECAAGFGAGLGGLLTPSKSPRSNRSTGSTIAGWWNPSATSRQLKPKTATTLCSNSQPWQRDAYQTASGKPGAVHTEDESQAEKDAARTTTVAAFVRQRPPRKLFPEHLPCERVVVAGPIPCKCWGGARLSTLTDQVGACCIVLDPLFKLIRTHVFTAER